MGLWDTLTAPFRRNPRSAAAAAAARRKGQLFTKQITPEQEDKVLIMFGQGFPQRKIAGEVELAQATVGKIIKDAREQVSELHRAKYDADEISDQTGFAEATVQRIVREIEDSTPAGGAGPAKGAADPYAQVNQALDLLDRLERRRGDDAPPAAAAAAGYDDDPLWAVRAQISERLVKNPLVLEAVEQQMIEEITGGGMRRRSPLRDLLEQKRDMDELMGEFGGKADMPWWAELLKIVLPQVAPALMQGVQGRAGLLQLPAPDAALNGNGNGNGNGYAAAALPAPAANGHLPDGGADAALSATPSEAEGPLLMGIFAAADVAEIAAVDNPSQAAGDAWQRFATAHMALSPDARAESLTYLKSFINPDMQRSLLHWYAASRLMTPAWQAALHTLFAERPDDWFEAFRDALGLHLDIAEGVAPDDGEDGDDGEQEDEDDAGEAAAAQPLPGPAADSSGAAKKPRRPSRAKGRTA